ncbi:T9SS type A sorting domain-containing protein [Flavobacterium sp.]|uniref:T9SS type A sorting domain-containing protein n=1 Tax=Flavobacterium sp. TaxID=239 RepID=UPI004033F510
MFLLHLDDNELLESINLKNGNIENSFEIHISESNTALQYICIDEDDQIYADSDVLFSTYCTFTPGGDYNVITGSLLFDNDGNCDTNGTVISNIKLNINDGTESGSTMSSTGLYNFFTQAGTYTITPDLENDLFTINPPSAEVSFTAVDSLVTTQNFCLTPNGDHPDLDIVIVPFGAQPGFDANYKIVYRNKGNQTLSGSVVFTYREDVLDFVSANPPQDASASGSLTWDYNDLAPFQQREIFVTLNVNGPMEIPPVNIDDQLGFTATVSPVAADETPGDNVFELKQIVVGSFDPNDITCLEGDSVHPDRIGEYLHYNINFENTGTAPATFIVVKDVIDTTQFDMATLQTINASHPVQATITGNKVEFRFDDIDLGPQGKGNVVFKIKTLNTLQVNDDVTQQADIFFDYNWPIVTNEAITVFEVLSRGEFEKDTSVKVYPNPSNGLVSITAASVIRSVELYDMQGRLLQARATFRLIFQAVLPGCIL